MSKNESIITRLDAWHKTKQGFAVFAAVELALAYAFGSWAIDSGSYWHYGLAVVFLAGGIQNTAQLIAKFVKH